MPGRIISTPSDLLEKTIDISSHILWPFHNRKVMRLMPKQISALRHQRFRGCIISLGKKENPYGFEICQAGEE